MDGKQLDTSKMKGKTVLLDFWATWCPPCVEEMPNLGKLFERFGSRDDFVMIGISRDFDENALRDYLKQSGKYGWHHVVGKKNGVDESCKKFGITWVPRVFVIGPDGKIVAKNLRGHAILETVGKLLTKKKP